MCNLLLIAQARNLSHDSGKWRDLITVHLISVLHCVFFLPIVVSSFAGSDFLLSSLGSNAQILLVAPMHLVLIYKFPVFMLVIPKFRQFLETKFWCGSHLDRTGNTNDSRENLLAMQEEAVEDEELGSGDDAIRNVSRTSEEVEASGRYLSSELDVQYDEELFTMRGNLVLNGEVHGANLSRNERTGLQVTHYSVRDTTL